MVTDAINSSTCHFHHAGVVLDGTFMQGEHASNSYGLLMVEFRNKRGVPRYGSLVIDDCGTFKPCRTQADVARAKITLGVNLTLYNNQTIAW